MRSDCFARWWRWEQRSLNGQRKQTMAELGARAGDKLQPLGLIPDARGLFPVLCPSCRCRLPSRSLPRPLHMQDQEQHCAHALFQHAKL